MLCRHRRSTRARRNQGVSIQPEAAGGVRCSVVGRGSLSPDETRRQLREIAEAGFGRVEIAYSGSYWATDEQRRSFEALLDEASKQGVQVDTTLGAAWPLSTPNTRAGTGLSLQELQYGRLGVTGGDTVDGPVPAPYDDPGNSRGGKLVAVTAARVVEAGPAVDEVGVPPSKSTVLDPGRSSTSPAGSPMVS